MVQYVKKWKNYFIVNGAIIHMDHELLQYVQPQNKIQQSRNYKWMGFLQKFHLVINYKKGSTNKLVEMLSRPSTSKITYLGTLMHMEPLTHDAYKEAYLENEDLKEVYQQLQSRSHVHDGDITVDYHL